MGTFIPGLQVRRAWWSIMYKVFLVEDEIVVREGIRNSIHWDKTPYILTGEAADGELALSMIQEIKPDILITDIRMPFMDGLTLSRIVKQNLPAIKIIILSGHDEFEYAREALSVGVDEYLLKPVSVQEMLGAMDLLAKKIDQEKRELLDIQDLKAKIKSSADILRDKLLHDFVSGKIDSADFIEKGKEFGLDLLGRSYIAAVIGIICPQKKEGQLYSARKIIESVMGQYGDSIWFSENKTRFVLLIRETGENSEAKKNVYSIAEAIKYEIENSTDCKVAAGIGVPAGRLGETVNSFSTAEKILNYELSAGLTQISDSSLLPAGEGTFDPAGLLNINGDMFFTKLKYAPKKDIDTIVQEYLSMIGNNWGEAPMLVFFLFGEIIVSASKIAEALGGDLREIVPFSLKQDNIQKIISSPEKFAEAVRSLLAVLFEFRDTHTVGRYKSVIVKAREYIDSNFSSPEISLFSTAAYVGISPNHLSTVFVQETGENFSGYLTRVRMDKAKFLLKNTAMKSVDIANETGINDPQYFSYIFKKNTGLSPREFRKNGQNREKPNENS